MPTTSQEDESAFTMAATAIRAELRSLHAGLTRIEEAVDRLPQHRPHGKAAVRDRPERYFRVLVGVYERGGRHGVSADELGAIGGRHGYDRRGLGGFFVGARAPLARVGGRARLTPEGLRLVDRYLDEVAR